MPQPVKSQVHVNRPLTNISTAYIQKAADFIADKMFPIVPVMKQSDIYFEYPKQYWFQTQARQRADGTESAGSGYEVNQETYSAKVFAVHKDVGDQIKANTDIPLNAERDATLFVTQQLLLKREMTFTERYFATGVWQGDPGGDYTPSVKWNADTGNPIKNIDDLKSLVKSQTGFLPNTLAVTNDVFYAIKNNPTVLDRIKYTQRAIVTEDLLAALFGVDKFLVLSAVADTANIAKTPDMGFLASNKALLVYSAPAPSILAPSAGYTFSWNGLFGAGAYGNRIKQFRMEQLEADRIEGEMAYDQKLVGADLGVLCTSVLS